MRSGPLPPPVGAGGHALQAQADVGVSGIRGNKGIRIRFKEQSTGPPAHCHHQTPSESTAVLRPLPLSRALCGSPHHRKGHQEPGPPGGPSSQPLPGCPLRGCTLHTLLPPSGPPAGPQPSHHRPPWPRGALGCSRRRPAPHGHRPALPRPQPRAQHRVPPPGACGTKPGHPRSSQTLEAFRSDGPIRDQRWGCGSVLWLPHQAGAPSVLFLWGC